MGHDCIRSQLRTRKRITYIVGERVTVDVFLSVIFGCFDGFGGLERITRYFDESKLLTTLFRLQLCIAISRSHDAAIGINYCFTLYVGDRAIDEDLLDLIFMDDRCDSL